MSQVKDPVCGMAIESATAAGGHVVYGSEEIYFCSDRCRRAFEAEPERFVPERHEPPYTVKAGSRRRSSALRRVEDWSTSRFPSGTRIGPSGSRTALSP